MKTQKQNSLDWWNSLGKTKQDNLALNYYGSTLLMDSEIEQIWINEVPPLKMYTEEEVTKLCRDSFSAGMVYDRTKTNTFSKPSMNIDEWIKENLK